MKAPLQEFGVDLTAAAQMDQIDPVIGRHREIERVIRVLVRRTKNNPVLLGEPGVGKTAIVEGLARRIVAGDIPPALAHTVVFALNLGSVLAGTGYRGDFEKRLQEIVDQFMQPGARRILFIDELHLLARAGRSEGGLDAGNLLKPLLARGRLPCIGASTPQEWTEMIHLDPALERRFQPVIVLEASPGETLAMLRGLRPRLEAHHGVEIIDEALVAAVEQSIARMPTRRLPDKAVDVLDEACALVRLNQAGPTPELAVAESELALAAVRFDLHAFAHLKHCVLPRLQGAVRPRVDAAMVGHAMADPLGEVSPVAGGRYGSSIT